MTSTPLPPHLARLLGRWLDDAAADAVQANAEAAGVPIQRRRMQLGNPTAAGFGSITVIYETEGEGEYEATADHI